MTREEFKIPLKLGEEEFLPGQRGFVKIPVGHLITHELVHLEAHVIRGKRPGPRVFITAGIHGDEINGIQIARLILGKKELKRLRGDLIILPVANPPAFLHRSRYLPDRRDLNRLFPGSPHGSFGARLAKILTQEILGQCTHGIDLHTGAINRPNLPQIRVTTGDRTALAMARAFNAPLILKAGIRENSLRHEVSKNEASVILYEAGEAGVLDHVSIRVGVLGVIRVLRHLEMLPASKSRIKRQPAPIIASKSSWIRAPRGGIFLPHFELGKAVQPDTVLGVIADPSSDLETPVVAKNEGVIIGRAKQAVVDEGDGLFHVAESDNSESAEEKISVREDHHGDTFDQTVFKPSDTTESE